MVPLAARAGRRCFLLEDDRAGVRKRGAEFLARELIPSLPKTLVQMSIAPDWEQRVGVAGAFDPAHDRPGLPDGVCRKTGDHACLDSHRLRHGK